MPTSGYVRRIQKVGEESTDDRRGADGRAEEGRAEKGKERGDDKIEKAQ